MFHTFKDAAVRTLAAAVFFLLFLKNKSDTGIFAALEQNIPHARIIAFAVILLCLFCALRNITGMYKHKDDDR